MKRALALGFGGFADLGLTFGEFLTGDYTLTVRYMPQYPYGIVGPLVAAASDDRQFLIGQGAYRDGSGGFKTLGPSTLMVQMGAQRVVYEVLGFEDRHGGPVGYLGVWQHLALVRSGSSFKLFLNGSSLTPFSGSETVPTADLPADTCTRACGSHGPGSLAD